MGTQNAVPNEKDLYVDPETGIYYGQVYIIETSGARQRKIRTLRTKDLRQARTNLRKLTAVLLRAKKVEGSLRTLFGDEWAGWIELGKNTGWAPGTYVDIESKGRKHLLPFFENHYLDEIDEHAWELYIADKWGKQPGLKLKLHGDYLAMYLHHCKRKRLIDSVPLIRNPDGEEDPGIPFSRSQQARLLWHSRKKPSNGNWSKTIGLQVRMGLKLGMRKNEILKLKRIESIGRQV
jgi:hypothetical protein